MISTTENRSIQLISTITKSPKYTQKSPFSPNEKFDSVFFGHTQQTTIENAIKAYQASDKNVPPIQPDVKAYLSEIHESLNVINQLVSESSLKSIQSAAIPLPKPINHIYLVGEGSSYHIGEITQHGILPSLNGKMLEYKRPNHFADLLKNGLNLENSLVIPVSQSGTSSTVVKALRQLKNKEINGFHSIPLTNTPNSPMGQGEFGKPVLIGAGKEKHVPATKSEVGFIAATALLFAYLGEKNQWRQNSDTKRTIEDLKQARLKMAALWEPDRLQSIATFTNALSARPEEQMNLLSNGPLTGLLTELHLKLNETAHDRWGFKGYSETFKHGYINNVATYKNRDNPETKLTGKLLYILPPEPSQQKEMLAHVDAHLSKFKSYQSNQLFFIVFGEHAKKALESHLNNHPNAKGATILELPGVDPDSNWQAPLTLLHASHILSAYWIALQNKQVNHPALSKVVLDPSKK